MPKIKRESRSFIVINEETLILEVQRRPILYDKALKGYRKPAIREGAWREVSVALGSPVEECKKRWRSLRDAFMKQYKLFQRGDTSIKKKWLFYEQMEFLAPFIDAEMKYEDDEFDTSGSHGRLGGQKILNQQIMCLNANDQNDYQSTQIEIEEYQEEDFEDGDEEVIRAGKSGESVYFVNGNEITEKKGSRVVTDPDERFLLSCLPILQRLDNKKNASARLQIQQVLYNVEFNEND